jgi:lysophospholipase L1-like esterase
MTKSPKIVLLPLMLLFAVIFGCFGCDKQSTMNNSPYLPTDTSGSAPKSYTYLALGDSYTIGQNVPDKDRFPAQTVELLKAKNFNVDAPHYIATTGWTTANLIDAINTEDPPKDFDIVTLLIGVNDQYQHLDTAGYRERFTQLLNKAIEHAHNRPSRVFVLSIPDYSVTPFVPASDKERVSKEIDEFNSINRQITTDASISYIDITPLSREAKNDPTLIASDGLHPSGKEYTKWALLLAEEIAKAIQ